MHRKIGFMKWTKLGLIFNPDQLQSLHLSAALMPMCEVLDSTQDLIRVYFAPRDPQNRSELRFFDIDLKNPSIPLKISDPLIQRGDLGTFDDSGITPGSLVSHNGQTYFYYTGWNLTVTVPMNNSIGIAVKNQDGHFQRLGPGPILTRTLKEPFSCASPFVMHDQGKFRMWYASMDKWALENGVPKHYYDIKYAESSDGVDWSKRGHVAITYETPEEYAFGRPFVLKESGLYKMWYAFRGSHYRIGYAESIDGIQWQRKDHEAGIDVSETGWDSEMIEYPYILDYKDQRYMFYNGNGYGRTGIGLAKLEK